MFRFFDAEQCAAISVGVAGGRDHANAQRRTAHGETAERGGRERAREKRTSVDEKGHRHATKGLADTCENAVSALVHRGRPCGVQMMRLATQLLLCGASSLRRTRRNLFLCAS